jgi:hypothetical protein
MRKTSGQQRWDDGDDRVRVLLECALKDSPTIVASIIVRTCDGPTGTTCDLLDHGACALVDGADVVVNLLGTTPDEQAVLDAMTGLRRPPAIAVEVGKANTLTKRVLLADIQRALDGSDRPS